MEPGLVHLAGRVSSHRDRERDRHRKDRQRARARARESESESERERERGRQTETDRGMGGGENKRATVRQCECGEILIPQCGLRIHRSASTARFLSFQKPEYSRFLI